MVLILYTICMVMFILQDNLVQKLFERPGDGTDVDTRILQAYTLQCTAEAQEGECPTGFV